MIDLKNIGKFMEQAKKIQEQLKEKQSMLAKQTVIGNAGGGLITIKLTCQYDALEVILDPAFTNEDRIVQQDLIKAALNDGMRKIQEVLQNSMSDLTSQLPTPDQLNLEE
jgi:nucleoid-associated protein EbfC